jgi:hypothetical protein
MRWFVAPAMLLWPAACGLDSSGQTPTSSTAGGAGGVEPAATGHGGGAVSSSSASTGPSGGDGGGGEAAGAGGDCATSTAADYVLNPVTSAELAHDGACDEPVWAAAAEIVFGSLDESDNAVSCRLLWEDAAPDRVHGCCTMADLDVEGSASGGDAGQIFLDDGLEYFFGAVPLASWDATTTKVMLSVSGAWHDGSWASGASDPAYDAAVQLWPAVSGDINGGARDGGYTIEWAADLGFDGVPEQIGQCNFMMNDSDLGVRYRRVAFGSWQTTFNDAGLFGTCKLACERQ